MKYNTRKQNNPFSDPKFSLCSLTTPSLSSCCCGSAWGRGNAQELNASLSISPDPVGPTAG